MASRAAVISLATAALLSAGGVLQSATAGGTLQSRAAAIVAPPTMSLRAWTPDSDNLVSEQGTVTVGGKAVSGVHVRVDSYDVPGVTDANGHFVYLVDGTLLARHVVTVADATAGKVSGSALSSSEQSALVASTASINVAYSIRDLKASRNAAGQPVVSGQLANAGGGAPPVVGLLTYELKGTVTDSAGQPVAGAQVSTRTLDRDYWTVSTVTDAQGHYSSLFTASAEAPGNPVPFTVRISKGDVVYQFLSQEFVNFQRLESATMDIRLPPAGYAMALPLPRSFPGALYSGIVAGVSSGATPVHPVSATWLDSSGRFTITLPKRLAGRSVSIWEAKLNLFSAVEAKPGGAIDLQDWPVTLPPDAPRDLATVTLK